MVAAKAMEDAIPKPRAEDLEALYLDDVFRYVSAFVRPPEEAEDVTMLVFHAAYRSFASWRREKSVRLWMLGIARRKVADHLRRHYRRPLTALREEMESPATDLEQSLLISQVLDCLPADQAQALVLKYVNGLTTEEIAHFMGRSVAAGNSLLQRARESFYSHGAVHFLQTEDHS